MKRDPWWKHPMTWLLWTEVKAHSRTRRELVALQDSVKALTDGSAEICKMVDGWKLRAESLYDIADPDLRDGVLGTLNTLDRLSVAEPERPRSAP